jgi:hypothetical protein
VPADDVAEAARTTLTRIFTKLDAVALGLALGSVAGAALFVATLVLALGGAPDLVGFLELLDQYFPGFRVSPAGSLLGLAYGLATGFALGWTFAVLRNAALALYLTLAYGRAEKKLLRRLFDFM